MFLMLFEMVHLEGLSKTFKDDPACNEIQRSFWGIVYFNVTHVEWEGCSLHDLIQPSFSFLVGGALAFSIKKRIANGHSLGRMLLHALSRSFILVTLGVLLRSLDTNRIVFRFDDTLCQIGLGYTFLFLIAILPSKAWYLALVLLLFGYWGAFLAYPLPSAEFDYAAVGVGPDWPYHHTGVQAHWNKNSNLAWAVDGWWMNLFPRDDVFLFSEGGYATLSFVPTLGTMLLGLMGGNWLRVEQSVSRRIGCFVIATCICFGLAWAVDWAELCPIVKRIWTPTWVLWSGGWCFAILLFFYLVADVAGWQRWAFPLTVIGSNSIVAYVMSYTTVSFLKNRLTAWLGPLWQILENIYPHSTPFLLGLLTFTLIWIVLYWMNQHKLYVRI